MVSPLEQVRRLETRARKWLTVGHNHPEQPTYETGASILRGQCHTILETNPAYCTDTTHGPGWAVGHRADGLTQFRPVDSLTTVFVNVDHLTEEPVPDLYPADTRVQWEPNPDRAPEAGTVVCGSAHDGRVYVRFDTGVIQAVPVGQLVPEGAAW